MRKPVKRPRCPRCRSFPSYYLEYSRRSQSFTVDEKGSVSIDGWIDDGGEIVGVEAVCACGHRWTPRGAFQIWDIPGHPNNTLDPGDGFNDGLG